MARSKIQWISVAARRRQQHLEAAEAYEVKRRRRQDKNAQSRLLRLPAELRNKIYELILPINRTIDARSLFPCKIIADGELRDDNDDLMNPADPDGRMFEGAGLHEATFKVLQQICRQIREETMSILYASNTLAMNYDEDGHAHLRWLASRDPRVAHMLRKLIFAELRVPCHQCSISGLSWFFGGFAFYVDLQNLSVGLLDLKDTVWENDCEDCRNLVIKECSEKEETLKHCASVSGTLTIADLLRTVDGTFRWLQYVSSQNVADEAGCRA